MSRPDGGGPDGLLAELLDLEAAVWQALVAGDTGADRRLLAPGFLGVYPTGFAGRDEHVGQVAAGPTVADYELGDARVLPLGPEHALLVYRARYRRPTAAGPGEPEVMYVSSLWQRDGDGWLNVFSQDTPAGDVDPP